ARHPPWPDRRRPARDARPRPARRALPGPGRPDPRPKLQPVSPGTGRCRAPLDRRPLVRGPRMVRRPALPHLVGHPEQPPAPLEREHRPGRHLPFRLQQQQRQHARPAGPPADLRAPDPPRHPHRARWQHHRHRRPLRGQAAQQPQRRRSEVGRLHLVHRPALRHPRLLRRGDGPARAADQPLPRRWPDRADHPRHRRGRPPQRPCLQPGRVEALRRRGRCHSSCHPRLRGGRRDRAPLQQPRLSPVQGGRNARWFPRGCGRQSLVRMGHGAGGAGRRPHPEPGRCADRPYPPARALRQSRFWRPAPQSAVHAGQQVALRSLREHPGRSRGL
ncbi:MAG: Gluconolactonase, partial [uncultured Craurococcus sp.]